MKKSELKIMGLSYSQSELGSYIVVLSEVGSNVKVPIVLNPGDAQQVGIKFENIKSKRPSTHDLFKSIFDKFNIDIREVYIHSIVEGVFYSKIITTNSKIGTDEIDFECSIGDALTLSLIYNCPILISEDVLKVAGFVINDDGTQPKLNNDEVDKDVERNPTSIKDLEHLMNDAIEREEYEIAADLRDRITNMKL